MAQSIEQQIPRARPGPISDAQLEQAITSAQALEGDWQKQNPDHFRTHLNLISMLAAPLLRECLHRRRAMNVIQGMSEIDNVTFLG